MHMGDAFGVPMVILYSGTELEEQWRPRRAPTRLLRRPTPCSPCYAFECPYQMECLDIPPAEVAAAVRTLLTEAPAPAGKEASPTQPAAQEQPGRCCPNHLTYHQS